jgi:hypothetical protein
MSDNLNEKFEELVTESDVMTSALSPAIVPGQSSGIGQYMQPVTGQVSDAQTRGGHKDSGFELPTSLAPGQSEEDNGGSDFEDPEGEENPGAKAAKHNKKVADAQTRGKHQDSGFSVKSSGYGVENGPNNTKVFGMEAINYSAAEDVAALTEGEEFSEEFKAKATTIFEAAVKTRIEEQVTAIASTLEEQFSAKLQEEIAALSEKVDETLNYAITTWVEENQVALDAGLKLEIAEEFMGGLKKVFEENYLNLPEEKVDVVETMTEELCEMEGRLNEQIERNIDLNNKLAGYQKQVILSQMSEGLVDTQREKLASLAEGVEFVSEEDFKNKVATLIGSYFPKHVVNEQVLPEVSGEQGTEEVSPVMAAYLQALSRWSN